MLDQLLDIIVQLREMLAPTHTEQHLDELLQTLPMEEASVNFDAFVRSVATHCSSAAVDTWLRSYAQQLFSHYRKHLHAAADLTQYDLMYMCRQCKVNAVVFDHTGRLYQQNTWVREFEYTIFLFNQGGSHWEPLLVRHKAMLPNQEPPPWQRRLLTATLPS
jgi:hypothetical protein